MSQKFRFAIIDDDRLNGIHIAKVLEKQDHVVTLYQESPVALQAILESPPDAVITDIMMPDLDGLELTQRLRAVPELRDMKIFVCSGKAFDYDRRTALEIGADAYIQKPVKGPDLLENINRIMDDKVRVKFWGVRGTLPRPGPDTLKYGGNTSCVTMDFPKGQTFIFDAGSGIKAVGDKIMASGKKRSEGKIFISHPHWDHINALPFFTPLYIPGNDYEIIGPAHGSRTIERLVSDQMDGAYFPITVREFGARISYRDLREGQHEINGIRVDAMLLSHPGQCLGYRVTYKDRSICYITDNEMFDPYSDYRSENYATRLADFIRGTDVLITDTTYTDEEYSSKIGWGHSSVSQVVDLAIQGEVKNLYLFHHDPDQDDDAIAAKYETARAMLDERAFGVVCHLPPEGTELAI